MRAKGNYNFWDNYSFFPAKFSSIMMLAVWFIVGMLISNVAAIAPLLLLPGHKSIVIAMVYPLLFIPAMIYAANVSRTHSFDGEKGYAMDNSHFVRGKGFLTALIVSLATIAAGFVSDPVTELLPEMPESLKAMLEAMTKENFLLNFICVGIMAPLFEEWLCRGTLLRSLLVFPRKDGTRGVSPLWAIVISALVFALIHGNPWQAIPAFILGVLFGYVYYRTGSLKLTMLMHCVNNTLSLVMTNIDKFKDTESWKELLSPDMYWIAFAASVMIIILTILTLNKIPLNSDKGNFDTVSAEL